MKRIAIIGGGISGLSAAYALEEQRRSGVSLEYALFESSPRLGGVLQTEHIENCLVETGPDSFITEKPWATDLCRKLGLADQLIGSNDAERKTYILVKGRLVPIPDGLMFMVPSKIMPAALSSLFSASAKLRIAREWFHPPRKSETDESVASFVERHYGPELVDRLADPMLSGVYGGDAAHLSVRAVLPRFADMEEKYGSLGRAMLAARKKIPSNSQNSKPAIFTSLKGGMQQLSDALVAQLPPSALRTNTTVQSIQNEESSWTVSAGYGTDNFDAVIIATPTHVAAHLLRNASPNLAAELGSIRYSSSVTVALGYGKNVRSSLPPGFGFLVPRSEGKRMLAATFVHNKFPHRAPEDQALVRCFLGGARDEQVLDLAQEEILRIAREELRQIIGLNTEPNFAQVYKWKNSMAQYSVGHLDRLERIEHLRQSLPGIFLAGNGYRGIGVPDCVRSGQQAAQQALVAVDLAATSSAI